MILEYEFYDWKAWSSKFYVFTTEIKHLYSKFISGFFFIALKINQKVPLHIDSPLVACGLRYFSTQESNSREWRNIVTHMGN